MDSTRRELKECSESKRDQVRDLVPDLVPAVVTGLMAPFVFSGKIVTKMYFEED